MAENKVELESIAQTVRSCTACGLHKGRKFAVPGEGSASAQILFIGEGPGKNEDETGRPFVGAAGKLLEELLASIGMTRENVFIANVVKCRPPDNRDPFPEEIATCTSLFLFNQIRIIKPTLIATLGRHSMHRFLPEDFQISRVHGKPYRRNKQVYLPLYHPAAALYHNPLKETLFADFRKIPSLLAKISQESVPGA